jgi:hypothetical protein
MFDFYISLRTREECGMYTSRMAISHYVSHADRLEAFYRCCSRGKSRVRQKVNA